MLSWSGEIRPAVAGIVHGSLPAFLCAFFLAHDSFAQPLPVTLEVGETHSREMVADQSFEYRIGLSASDIYRVEIDQGGFDLQVEVESPNGGLTRFDSPLFRDDTELLLIEPGQTGEYTLRLKNREFSGAVALPSIAVVALDEETLSRGPGLDVLRLISTASAANAEKGQGGWAAALENLKRCADLLQHSGHSRTLARCLYGMATIEYRWTPDYRAAREHAAHAAANYREAGMHHIAANANQLQAGILIELALAVEKTPSMGLAPEARDLFEQANVLFERSWETQRSLGYPVDAARNTNYIGLIHYYRGDYARASPYYQEAAAVFREFKEWRDEFIPLSNLATIDRERGYLIRATESFERILEILPPSSVAQRASYFDLLGAAQMDLGLLDESLESFDTSRRLHEQAGHRTGLGRALTGLGSVYLAYGDNELALDFLENALRVRRETEDGQGILYTLNAIGEIHRRSGNHRSALEAHLEAISIAAIPWDKARTNLAIGRCYLALGETGPALEYVAASSQTARENGMRKLLADSLVVRGDIQLSANELENAASSYRESEILYREFQLNVERSVALFGLARAARADELPEESIRFARQAIDTVEDIRGQLIAPEMRAFFLATRQDYYIFLIDTLLETHASAPAGDNHRVHQALEVSEQRRARALIDLFNETSLAAGPDNGGNENRRPDLYRRMAESRYRLNLLLDDPAIEARDTEISLARHELAQLENQLNLLEIGDREDRAMQELPVRADVLDTVSIQALLGEETVLLQYALGTERSFVFQVTKDSVRAWPLAPRDQIETLAKSVYEQLRRPAADRHASAMLQEETEALSRAILPPGGTFPGKRLVVAADGVLHYLPFSVLLTDTGQDQHQRLVEDHQVVHVPSVSALAAQHRKRDGDTVPTKTLALYADPVFRSDDRRLTDNGSPRTDSPAGPSRQAPPLAGTPDLERLPATAREAAVIAELVEPGQKLLATGFGANLGNVTESNLGDYHYVHFATHGRIDSRYPTLSWLAFSLYDETGLPRDGLLHLHDVYQLDLAAELVTLSACDTALGREISGEGLTGLVQGFMYAGSRRVLASLWQVPDRATAELMKRFYTNLLDRNHNPAEALRAAQLDLSSQARWRHPYFWSAFVLQGDWD